MTPFCLVNHLGLAEVELGDHDLHALRVDGAVPGGGVPGQRFLNPFDEVLRAQARLGPAGTPHVDRPVGPSHLRPATRECDQVAHVVGVQVRQEHLVELVDRQLQTGVVRQGAAPDIEKQDVALRVADLDHHAGRGLRARVPGIAAAKHRHAQLAVFERFCARDEHLGVVPPRRADNRSQGDRLCAAGKCRQAAGTWDRCSSFCFPPASISLPSWRRPPARRSQTTCAARRRLSPTPARDT